MAGSLKAADSLTPKLGAEEKGSRILIDASNIIVDFTKREGRVGVDKVTTESKERTQVPKLQGFLPAS